MMSLSLSNLSKGPWQKLVGLFLLLSTPICSFSEGTKQFMPSSGTDIRVQVFDNNNIARDFMTYIADTASRLHIHIEDVNSEAIYFGFRQNNGDVFFRLRDPLGNIVISPALVPSSGAGFISTYNEAVAGPDILDPTNGYTSMSYTPSIPGDYYIEFNPGDADNFINGSSNVKRTFNFFDITVVDMSDTSAIDGRLWSKAWDFNCMSGSNRFEAAMHIYAIDSILTEVDFNGIQPWGFVIYSNSSGPQNTGDVVADRRSVTGQVTQFAEHKLFLQLPDSNVYPGTKRIPEFGTPSEITGCFNDGFEIGLNATHKGVVEVFIDLNNNGVYDAGTADVFFTKNIGVGDNTIPWDGLDGLGVLVPDATTINLYFQYFAGLSHLPLYDVENHTNGFNVVTVAPPNSLQDIFWDDSNIGGGTVNTAVPCNSDCHTWGNSQGNVNTISTWWVTNYDYDTVSFTLFYDCTPVVVNDTVNTGFNIPITVDVQANDTDPDADPLTTSLVTTGNNGTAVVVGTNVQYTPNPGYNGPDTVQYVICDNNVPAPVLCDTGFIYIFVECDDDGLTSAFDNGTDSDGDGIANECDLDSDNDGVPDAVEGDVDSDGDGVPDFLDLDSDNDGIPDAIEANGGVAPSGYVSNTGRISGIDTDNDGLLDVVDNAPLVGYGVGSSSPIADVNTDGDAFPDRIDRDSDADGIVDLVEVGGTDADNDGSVDALVDLDQNGIHDALLVSPYVIANNDGDSFPNYRDRDSDGDGITDNREGQTTAGFVAIGASTDSDGDGIIDIYDVNSGNTPVIPTDTDGDGTPDYLDTDSDNDSVLDIIEGDDNNQDGLADGSATGLDADNDGVDDGFELDNGGGYGGYSDYALQNLNGDAEPDWRDLDDDGDGISTSNETGDVDGNGTPDYLEVASCPIGFTLQTGTISGNGDAVFSESGVNSPTDALGTPDGNRARIGNGDNMVIDLTDNVTVGSTVVLTIARNQGNGSAAQALIEQSANGSSFSNGQTYTSTVSQPTYESFNYTISGASARYIRVTRTARTVALDALSYSFSGLTCEADSDMDGVPDVLDVDDDNDGILDVNEGFGDFDGDGIPNNIDLDSDNDGIPDAVEANGGYLPANMNTQGRYTSSYALANDSDGDGQMDDVDTSTGGTALVDPNTDGTGNVDRLDLDSDGDGLLDAVEANDGSLPANMDNNGQYPVAYATANDADGDGLMDDLDPDDGGQSLLVPDNDGDTTKDYRDLDSDGDGISDNLEGFDPDVSPSGNDSDGDGIDDAYDPDCTPCGGITGTPANLPDEDLDGRPDYLDTCLISVQAGNWNDPNTWGGSVPDSFTCVIVQHTVALTNTGFASSVTINTGGTINTSNKTLKVYGDLTENGGTTSGTGTICMCGNAAQTVLGTLNLTNFEVDNPAGVSIDNTGSVTVSNQVTLTEGTLSNTSGGTFMMSGSSGQTGYTSGSGTGNYSGDIGIERYTDGCDGYVTLGAPFDANYSDFNNLYLQGCTGCYNTSSWQNTYTYNESTAGTNDLGYEAVTDISNSISKGTGFLSYQWSTTLNVAVEITGDYSMDPFSFPVSYTTSAAGNLHDGFNLFANPYPAPIDWTSATGWAKSGFCDAIYTYNRCLNQYSSYVSGISVNGGTQYISAMSGFWVKAHEGSASLQINRNAIADDVQQALYSQLPLSVLKVKMDAYGYSDETAISFGDTASSNGLGSWYGATKVITEVPYYPSLFTVQEMPYDTFNMAINMMPSLEQDRVVDLKVMAGFLGNYSFSFSGMESFDSEICILLEDTATGIFTNLRVDTSYTVLLDSTGTPDGRYRIHFTHPVELSVEDPSCNGSADGIAIAKAKPGVLAQFTWTNQMGEVLQSSSGLANADTLEGVSAGNYYVSMLDTVSPHCGDVTRLVSLFDPAPITTQVSVTNASYCKVADGSIAVSQTEGGTAPYAYYWSNGDTTQSLTNIAGGNYMLWITDANGCKKTVQESVSSPAVISSHFTMSTDTLDLSQGSSVSFTNKSVNAQSYLWDFADNSALSTTVDPVHQFNQPGNYVVKLEANSPDCSSDFSRMLTVHNTVGVSETASQSGVQFQTWPNPSTGKIYLSVSESLSETLRIKLVDLTGKTVWKQEVQHSPNTPIELNFDMLPDGIYLIRVETGNESYDRKISVHTNGDN